MESLHTKALVHLIRRKEIETAGMKKSDYDEFIQATVAYCSTLTPNLTITSVLTLKEIVCLILLASGNEIQFCADILKLSRKSIHTYERRIREKLGAHNRIHALYIAIERKYILIQGKP